MGSGRAGPDREPPESRSRQPMPDMSVPEPSPRNAQSKQHNPLLGLPGLAGASALQGFNIEFMT